MGDDLRRLTSDPRLPVPDELPKQYDHLAAQQRWYPYWESHGYFQSDPDPERKRFPKGPYTIVIPPPNVTGACTWGMRSITRSKTS